ncbi:uncharacterized protein KY384_004161 [Bacidia gigantensis]|uniref:uncharacterized protein n=1 Tax=Bacidia gigantensis TaxID=2732470 RepID=UPI001D04A5E6|nr:uncharacterized protein KY384_004161 [Bacidia gigantensis]KAG8530804.1 hypothetical protein KY384_004161 [Bacidia gigantensis]
MASINITAKQLRSLHVPGKPIIMANVYDTLSAEAVGSLPSCHALHTASYAVARASGTNDDDMTLETNLAAAEAIIKVAMKFNKPLSVDWQDAYGKRLDEGISSLLKMGVVGINLEDCDKETQHMHSPEEAVARIKQVLEVTKREGVPDFVLNARCDVLVQGGEMDEVIKRGKLYLDAGATTVFVWGGSKRGVSRAEVERMVKEFQGRVNVSMKLAPGNLTAENLVDLGVARISVGPQLQAIALEHFGKQAEALLQQRK